MKQDIITSSDGECSSRRNFLKKGAMLAAGVAIAPNEVLAGWGDTFAWDKELDPLFKSTSIFTQDSAKSLKFFNVHTGKHLNLTYYENGQYIDEALDEINIIMGDYRANEYTKIHRQLIDTLYDIKKLSSSRKPINIISAYRSPKTNRLLRRTHRGVAKRSYHMSGMAIDINIEDVSLRNLKNAAMTLRKGGVGYYPRSNFVHIDVGNFRTWRG